MYVVLEIPSKNAACSRPDKLHRIFRKLRLAVFERMCRLPIGLSNLRVCRRSRFPIFRCRMSGIANGIVAAAAGSLPLLPRRSTPYFSPFWAGRPSDSDKSGRQPASLATHGAGRAYYIYVASHDAKHGILAGNPRGVLAGLGALQAIRPAKTGTGNREVGAIAPLRRHSLTCPFGRATVVAHQAR
jgi:hypothetical protein